MRVDGAAVSRNKRSLGFYLFVLILLLPKCGWSESKLSIVDAGVEQSEDAPFVSQDYFFLPGDFVYYKFKVAGFSAKTNDETETRQIALQYQVTPADSHDVPLAEVRNGQIETVLHAEDKDWKPLERGSFLVPPHIAAGECQLHIVVKDSLGNTAAEKNLPFRIGGVKLQDSKGVTIQEFRFFRDADGAHALELSAFRPGDTVFTQFIVSGFAKGEKNTYHVTYGVTVTAPDGRVYVDDPVTANLEASSFYPAQFLPGALDITTSSGSAKGEYVLAATVHDLIANKTYTLKKSFTLE